MVPIVGVFDKCFVYLRHSRRLLAGIQVTSELDPPMKTLGGDGLLTAELFGRSAMLRGPVRLVLNKECFALAFDADHGRNRVL